MRILPAILLLLLSLCSCSSPRKTLLSSAVSSDTISVVSAASDSVGSGYSESFWSGHVVEISGLEILFQPPEPQLAEDTASVVARPRALPQSIRIDAMSIARSSGSRVDAMKDSVSEYVAAGSAASVSVASESKIRSPAAANWQVALVIIFAMLVIAGVARIIYRSVSTGALS